MGEDLCWASLVGASNGGSFVVPEMEHRHAQSHHPVMFYRTKKRLRHLHWNMSTTCSGSTATFIGMHGQTKAPTGMCQTFSRRTQQGSSSTQDVTEEAYQWNRFSIQSLTRVSSIQTTSSVLCSNLCSFNGLVTDFSHQVMSKALKYNKDNMND